MDNDQIVDLLFDRSESAITEMNNKFGDLIKSIALNVGLNITESEEVLNDTLFSVWLSIPPKKPEYLISYILKIARRASIDKLRSKTAEKRCGEIDTLYSELYECIPDSKNIENALNEKEIVSIINTWLHNLDFNSRRIFIQRYFYAKSITDIAAELKISKSNVTTKLHRLRKKLEKVLEKEGIFYE